MLAPMKTLALASLALASLALSGCIIVIEQAPAEKTTPAQKATAKPKPDNASK
jgi:PBP1b-binding outer membrane lipoprotein LpoB